VRRLRRLAQKRAVRWREGVCVLEGPDLVTSALAAGADFEAVYVDEGERARDEVARVVAVAESRGVRVYALAPGVLKRVADAVTPQPVMAAVRLPLSGLEDFPADAMVLVLHDLRDPGNAGTLVRSADAAGAAGVVFTGESVDPFNPKTLRATAGSVFHLPVAVDDLERTLAFFHSRGVTTWATVVRGGVDHRAIDLSGASVVVIGNEAEGLDEDTVARCDGSLTIAMAGAGESLNAGVAGSLLAFEAFWQRRGTPPTPPAPSL
jgi:TrmH family RNA methyltransferase